MKTRFMLSSVLLVGALTVTRADDVPPELAWVPTNCSGFIHVRFHDLWSGPAGKSVLNAASAIEPKMLDQIEQTLGVPLARIDRITILLPEFDPNAKQPGFVVRVTTTRPYDRRDVMSA